MELFFKLSATAIVGVVIGLILKRNGSDTGLLLSVVVCAMIIIGASSFLEPIISFCQRLREIGCLDISTLNILLKTVGVGLIAKLSALLCGDSGNQALGKTIQFTGTVAMLWLALPLLEEFIQLLDDILGTI